MSVVLEDFDVHERGESSRPLATKSSHVSLFVAGLIGFSIAAAVALIIGLSVGLTSNRSSPSSTSNNVTDVTTLPFSLDLVAKNFSEVLRRARGTKVRFWFWGLDPQINAFVDATYGSVLAEEFGVTLESVHINDTFVAVDTVRAEVGAQVGNSSSNGSVDLIWINGENFAAMKRENLLFGPFADKLPLSSTVDWNNSAIAYDFGLSVDFMESVWSQAQYQFIYLPATTPEATLPRSFQQWLDLARYNRTGRLTYIFPDPGDFLAARFLKQAMMELAPPGYLTGPFNQTRYNEISPRLWQALNDVKPFLWQGGQIYPSSFADQDALFFQGQIDFSSTHDVAGAQTNIDDGKYPPGSKAYIWHTYSIGDFNYVAIPVNAANKPAALALANLILRPDRQGLQKIPSRGFGLGYGINYNVLSRESKTLLDLSDELLGDAHVSSAELSKYLVGDLTADYHNAIVRDWLIYVGSNSTAYTVNKK